jgi:hypothetical protein
MNGLPVYVLRSKHDCTNHGISSKRDTFTLIEIPDTPEVTEYDQDAILIISERRGHMIARPMKDPEYIGWMFGGNFVYTSDSRFPNDYPIPIHDRQETQEQQNILSV